MSGPRPLTRTQLLAQMLHSFRNGNISIVSAAFSPAKQSADAEYKWINGQLHMRMRLDAAQDSAVAMVVHELLHAHADDPDCPYFAGVLPREWHSDLRENALQGIEVAMVKHLTDRYPRKFEQWRAAISRKQVPVETQA